MSTPKKIDVVPEKDPYEVLGVPSDASDAAISKAYKKICLKVHPDKQKKKSPAVKEAAAKRFHDVQVAREFLLDPEFAESREKYDAKRRGEAGPEQPTTEPEQAPTSSEKNGTKKEAAPAAFPKKTEKKAAAATKKVTAKAGKKGANGDAVESKKQKTAAKELAKKEAKEAKEAAASTKATKKEEKAAAKDALAAEKKRKKQEAADKEAADKEAADKEGRSPAPELAKKKGTKAKTKATDKAEAAERKPKQDSAAKQATAAKERQAKPEPSMTSTNGTTAAAATTYPNVRVGVRTGTITLDEEAFFFQEDQEGSKRLKLVWSRVAKHQIAPPKVGKPLLKIVAAGKLMKKSKTFKMTDEETLARIDNDIKNRRGLVSVKVSDLEQTIKSLEEQLSSQKDESQQVLARKEEQSTKLSIQFRALQAEIAVAKEELESSQETATTRENELSDELEALQQKVKELNSQLETLQVEIDAVKEELKSTQEAAAFKEQELLEEIQNLKSNLEEMENPKEEESSTSQLEILQAEVEELKSAKETALSKEKQLSEEIEELKSQLEETKVTNEEESSHLEAIQAKIDNAKEVLNESNGEEDLLDEIQDKQEETDNSKEEEPSSQVETLQAEVRKGKEELQLAQETASSQEKQLSDEIEELQRRLEENKTRNGEESSQLEALQAEVSASKEQLKSQETDLSSQIEALKSQLEKDEKSRQEQSAQLEALQAEVSEGKEELRLAQQAMDLQEKDLTNRDQQIQLLEGQLEEAKTSTLNQVPADTISKSAAAADGELESKEEHWKSQVASLQSELEGQVKSMEDLQQKNTSLGEQLVLAQERTKKAESATLAKEEELEQHGLTDDTSRSIGNTDGQPDVTDQYLESRLASLQQQLEGQAQVLKATQQEMEAKDTLCNSLKESLGVAQDKAHSLEATEKKNQAKEEGWKSQIQSLQNQVDGHINALNEMEQANKNLRVELDSAEGRAKRIENLNDEFGTKQANWTSQVASLQIQLKELTKALKDSQQENSFLQDRIKSLQATGQAREDEHSLRIKSMEEEWQAKSSTLQTMLGAKETHCKSLQESLGTAQDNTKIVEELERKLLSKEKDQKTQIESLQTESQRQAQALEKSNRQKATLQERIQLAQDNIKSAKEIIEEYRAKEHNWEVQMASLQSKLQEQAISIQDTKQEHDALLERLLAHAKDKSQTLASTEEESQAKEKDLKSQITSLQTKLHGQIKAVKRSHQENNSLRHNLELAQDKAKRVEDMREQFQTKEKDWNVQLASLQHELEGQAQENNILGIKLELAQDKGKRADNMEERFQEKEKGWSSQIASLQSMLQEQAKTMEDVQQEKKTLQENIEQSQARNKILVATAEERDKENASVIKSMKEEWHAKSSTQACVLEAKNALCQTLQESLQSTQAKAKSTENMEENFKAMEKDWKSQIESLQAEVQRQAQTLQETHHEKAMLEGKIQHAQQDIKNARDMVEESQAKEKDWKCQKSTLQSKLDQRAQDLKDSSKEIASLQEQLDHANRMAKDFDSLDGKLQAKEKDWQAQIASLQGELKGQGQALKEAQQENKAIREAAKPKDKELGNRVKSTREEAQAKPSTHAGTREVKSTHDDALALEESQNASGTLTSTIDELGGSRVIHESRWVRQLKEQKAAESSATISSNDIVASTAHISNVSKASVDSKLEDKWYEEMNGDQAAPQSSPSSQEETLATTPTPSVSSTRSGRRSCDAALAVIERSINKLYVSAQKTTSDLSTDLDAMLVDPDKEHSQEEIHFFHENQLPFWIERFKHFSKILALAMPLHKRLFETCRVAHSIGEVAKGALAVKESEIEKVFAMAKKYASS